MNDTVLASAARRCAPRSAWSMLRCGGLEWPGGGVQRTFYTPQYAMCWVAAGTGFYRDASGRSWRLGPGVVLQRFPNAAHDILSNGLTRWWYLGVPASAYEALRQVGLDRRLPARFTAMARRLRDAPDDELAGCLAAMIEFMVELHLRAARARVADPRAQPIEVACRLIAQDPVRRLRPKALAHQVGMGYHAFRKSFARRMGCGATSWALRQRLQLAQELLTDRGLSVTEIAERVGYRDPLQSSAIFRSRYGVSPSRWRGGA